MFACFGWLLSYEILYFYYDPGTVRQLIRSREHLTTIIYWNNQNKLLLFLLL